MMKKSIILLAAAALLGASAVVQAKSDKRGYSVNSMMAVDYAALEPGSSWFYDWSLNPPSDEGNKFVDYDLEFCPMVWNANYNVEALEATYQKYKDHIKYVLGYNEPNFTDQAHLTPAQAAADWPRFQEWALSHNLKIVSPAVNWSSWQQYNDPITWLDEFFSLLPDKGEKIDYVACHFYMPNGKAVMDNIERLKKYGKPIWLTEFCYASGNISNDPATQNRYMLDILPKLEQDPMVFRYAWFMARTTNASWGDGINLLNRFPNQGTLTDNGYAFTYLWDFPTDFYHNAGEKFAAADFINQAGILVGKNTDEDQAYSDYKISVNDLGNGSKTEYVEYQLQFDKTGTYDLNLRAAVRSATKLDIFWNGTKVISDLDLTSTGGANKWGDVKISNVNIDGETKGTLRITPTRSMQISTIRFERTGEVAVETIGAEDEATISVEGNSIVGADAVYTISGTQAGSENLQPGIYIAKAGTKTSKVVIR